MPFDATPQTDLDELCKHDEVLRVLVDADRLLSGPEKWCQGAYHSDGKYCLVGSLLGPKLIYTSIIAKVYYLLCNSLGTNHNVEFELTDWNDAPERTFSDVKALFAKAISERTRAIRARQELVNA